MKEEKEKVKERGGRRKRVMKWRRWNNNKRGKRKLRITKLRRKRRTEPTRKGKSRRKTT